MAEDLTECPVAKAAHLSLPLCCGNGFHISQYVVDPAELQRPAARDLRGVDWGCVRHASILSRQGGRGHRHVSARLTPIYFPSSYPAGRVSGRGVGGGGETPAAF